MAKWLERVLSFLVGCGEGRLEIPMPDLETAVPLHPWTYPEMHACRHLHQVQSLLSVTTFLAVPLVLTCFLAHLWSWQDPLPSCLRSASTINQGACCWRGAARVCTRCCVGGQVPGMSCSSISSNLHFLPKSHGHCSSMVVEQSRGSIALHVSK